MVEGCSEQKYDVTNDLTSDLATARCMSDNVFVAGLNQVCSSGEGAALGARSGYLQASPASPAPKIAAII